ncbi:DUF2264 domain-containing protein [Chryseobacterium hagamense]|uniref:DUF2264 domain-containing protein n=1 Tax=Chryseobacterium hagamense TaxID=395935 RepID=A0A511YPW0_9FLAO|nr:DUF2264 domain-containing protein [Chryseobacterium hagamense]GEN77234.1 hypothetical protein CHA01nite_29740 [Chryseobacterium hagamense]
MKTIHYLFSLFFFSLMAGNFRAQPVKNAVPEVFRINQPDYKKSPYTGMTREHWKDAAKYMLQGAFSYVHTLDDPMVFPKQPGKSYPRDPKQLPTEKLEGLSRTLFIASALLREDPDLEINGIKLAEYYRHQVLNLIDPKSPSYIPLKDPKSGPSQILVEFGALSISLFAAPDVLWKPLTREQKDKLAATMLSYGDGPTIASNWRFFNIFILSFFKENGYPVNEPLMREYLSKSLGQYRADGWYNDSPAYDYYSMWAFQLYGILWSDFYGKKNEPEIAARFIRNFKEMGENYPYAFSEDGQMNMWGRSISYRFASISPLPFLGTLKDEKINYGWMRRISSGTLLQFLENPDFMEDRVPTLGFYGHFEPAVQVYSCRGSVYWMGKAFLALLLPPDNPFWTATENTGPWKDEFKKDRVYNKFQKGSNLMITNYPAIGAAEMRSWCHEKVADDWQQFRSSENYNRLAYNTAFPWQADGKNGEVAMNYVLKNKKNEWEAFRLYTFRKYENEIYYRDVVLETDDDVKMNLAEITLPNGILRVDKNNSGKAVDMRLGHYALPQLEKEIKVSVQKAGKYKATIIDNGVYQLAMVPLSGWEKVESIATKGLHPVSTKSMVLNASAHYSPGKDEVYSTLLLWKKSGEKWSQQELMPVKEINTKSGNTITVSFSNGTEKKINDVK